MSSASYNADVCSKCNAVRPLSEFYEAGADWGKGASRPVCRTCRSRAANLPALAAIDWGDTPTKYRQALRAHLEAPPGTPFARAVEAAGLPKHFGLETILSKSAECRRIYQQLLHAEGMDQPFMLAKLGLMLHAMRPAWNKATESWDYFPDNATQMKALETLHKLHGLLGAAEDGGASKPTVVFLTNIGSGQKPDVKMARTHVIDLTPSEPIEEASDG